MIKKLMASILTFAVVMTMISTVSFAAASVTSAIYNTSTGLATITGTATTATTSTTLLALKNTYNSANSITSDDIAYIDQIDSTEYTNGMFSISFKVTPGTLGATYIGGTDMTSPVAVSYTNISDDATLSSVTVNDSAATYDNTTATYTSNVGSDISLANIIAIPTVTGSTVTLKSGTTVVTSPIALGEAGTTTTLTIEVLPTNTEITTSTNYTLNIVRAATVQKSNIATLSALSLSAGTLSPEFNPTAYSYTANVENSISSITVTATNTDGNATNNAAGSYDLAVGSNTITITVTAEDGTTQQNYVITVTRAEAPKSTIATLSALSLSAGTLSPEFNPTVYSYTANVENSISSITVTATNTDGKASNNNAGSYALAEGDNMITITVTAEDGTTKQNYVITVQRAYSSGGETLETWNGTVTTNYSSGYLMQGYDNIILTSSDTSNAPAVKVGGVSVTPTFSNGVITISTAGLVINDAFPIIPSITLTYSGYVPYTVGSSPVIYSRIGYKNLLLSTMPTSLSYTADADGMAYTVRVPKPVFDLKDFTLQASGYEETEIATNATTIARSAGTVNDIAALSTVSIARSDHTYVSATSMANGTDKRYCVTAKLLDGTTEIFNKTYDSVYVPSRDSASSAVIVTGRVISTDGTNTGKPIEGVIVRSFKTTDKSFAVTGPDGTFRLVIPKTLAVNIKLYKAGCTERTTNSITTSSFTGINSISKFITSGNTNGDIALYNSTLLGDADGNGSVNSSDAVYVYGKVGLSVTFPTGY